MASMGRKNANSEISLSTLQSENSLATLSNASWCHLTYFMSRSSAGASHLIRMPVHPDIPSG